MAKLETTVEGPSGPIASFPGRISAQEAKERAAQQLAEEVAKKQWALANSHLWDVKTHRGSTVVLSFEELHASQD